MEFLNYLYVGYIYIFAVAGITLISTRLSSFGEEWDKGDWIWAALVLVVLPLFAATMFYFW